MNFYLHGVSFIMCVYVDKIVGMYPSFSITIFVSKKFVYLLCSTLLLFLLHLSCLTCSSLAMFTNTVGILVNEEE